MIDFAINNSGDLLVGSDQNVLACSDDRLRQQMALCRIKSISKDWHEAHIGADLERFIGEPTDAPTIQEMEDTVVQALCFDNFFASENIFINTSLTDKSYVKMLVYIKALNNKGSFCIDVNLDYVKGVNVIIGG